MCDSGGSGYDPNASEAALRTAKLSEEQWNWAKNYFETTLKPMVAEQTELSNESTRQQMNAAQAQEGRAADTFDFYRSNIRPVEQGLVDQVRQMDQTGYTEQKVAQATAGVEQAFANSDREIAADMARRGISPGSGQQIAEMRGNALARAATLAGTANATREQVDALAFARKKDISSLGHGLQSDASTQTAQALTGSASAAQTGNQTLGAAGTATNPVNQSAGNAIQGNIQAGNLWANMAKTSSQEESSRNGALIGGAATIAAAVVL